MSSPNQVPHINLNNHPQSHGFLQVPPNQNLQELPQNHRNTRYVPNLPVRPLDFQTWIRNTMQEALSVYELMQISQYLKMRMHYIPVMDIDLGKRPDPGAANEPETCAICILEYQNGDTVGRLQCEHEFHVDCIKKWLLSKKICPLCRGSVVPTP